MSRKIDDLMDKPWPPVGKNPSICVGAKLESSKVKKTPYIRIIWVTADEEFQYNDDAFCTEKSIRRLALIASHVCGFTDELPDSDKEAMIVLRDFILENIAGKSSVVIVEEKQEIFIPESGPNMGRKTTITKKKVAFNGYENPEEASVPPSGPPLEEEKKPPSDGKKDDKDDLPF